jgi:hypothetical protein
VIHRNTITSMRQFNTMCLKVRQAEYLGLSNQHQILSF